MDARFSRLRLQLLGGKSSRHGVGRRRGLVGQEARPGRIRMSRCGRSTGSGRTATVGLQPRILHAGMMRSGFAITRSIRNGPRSPSYWKGARTAASTLRVLKPLPNLFRPPKRWPTSSSRCAGSSTSYCSNISMPITRSSSRRTLPIHATRPTCSSSVTSCWGSQSARCATCAGRTSCSGR